MHKYVFCKFDMRKLTAIFLLMLAGSARGQDKVAASAATDSAVQIYFRTLGETWPIHNGRVFYGYPVHIEHAFFPDKGWQKGSVLYDGVWYRDISLMYDAYMDELVILHPSSTPIRLVSERVHEFHFLGLSFIRLEFENNSLMRTGFYEKLVEGPVTVYAKRTKKVEENIVDLALEKKFVTAYQFYAMKDGVFKSIQKQKSLLEIMKDKRQTVVQHLKQQNIKFRKEKEKAIVEMARIYNQSPN